MILFYDDFCRILHVDARGLEFADLLAADADVAKDELADGALVGALDHPGFGGHVKNDILEFKPVDPHVSAAKRSPVETLAIETAVEKFE